MCQSQPAPKLNAAFPHPNDATHKIWSRLANWLQRYSSSNVWNFRHSRASNSKMSCLNQPNIKLHRAFMPVLVTSNFDDDSIKNEQARMETPFSNYNTSSVKPTYGVNYVLKSPPYAEIQDQRRPPYFQYSVLYVQNQTPRRPLQWKNPAHLSILPTYLWCNCACACTRPLVCRSVICSYWTSCIGQPIIRVPQVHEWQVSHVAISGFWPLIAVEVWKTNRSIMHRISSWIAIILLMVNGFWSMVIKAVWIMKVVDDCWLWSKFRWPEDRFPKKKSRLKLFHGPNLLRKFVFCSD